MEVLDEKTERKIACALSGCLTVLNEQDDLSRYLYENSMYIFPMSDVDIVIYPSNNKYKGISGLDNSGRL